MDALTRRDPAESERAISALRAMITERPYAPGDRLPAERKLIVSMGLSRTTLRKALDALEREGAIWRHVGKGTFVAGGADAREAEGLTMLSHRLTPVRMMRARLCIEPAIAREAAINASDAAVADIRRARDRARSAPSWKAYETQDDALHRAIAEATDNMLLLSLFDQLNQVRRAVAWEAVIRVSDRPPPEHPSYAEHDRIAAAIDARDPPAAQEAMRRHIGSVSARLFGEA